MVSPCPNVRSMPDARVGSARHFPLRNQDGALPGRRSDVATAQFTSRFEDEYDPGPVQIQARKVHFDVSDVPLHWIPDHPVASNFASLLNIVLPPIERWFVAVFNEALPLVKDSKLAEDMRGFIGQEATHADVHEQVLHDLMVARGIDPKPLLDQVDFIFSRTLAPSTSPDPKRRLSHLCDRLWLIAAIEHYTAVLGDFVAQLPLGGLRCRSHDHRPFPLAWQRGSRTPQCCP